MKKLLAVSILVLGLNFATITLNNPSEPTFNFKTRFLAEDQPMKLDDIKKFIERHERKRLTENWVFTSRIIHCSTLQAIKTHSEVPQEKRNPELLQEILRSHANYLYHPLYLQKQRHVALVDALVMELTNKRLEISLLDAHALSLFSKSAATTTAVRSSKK